MTGSSAATARSAKFGRRTGPEGPIEHNTHIVEARTKLFKDYADNHFMTVYGEPTPQLIDS